MATSSFDAEFILETEEQVDAFLAAIERSKRKELLDEDDIVFYVYGDRLFEE